MTDKYGINGTDHNEYGHRCEPKPVWGVDDHKGGANLAFRNFDRYAVEELIRAFHKKTGKLPTEYYTTAPKTGARFMGWTMEGIGFVSITIISDWTHEEVK